LQYIFLRAIFFLYIKGYFDQKKKNQSKILTELDWKMLGVLPLGSPGVFPVLRKT
jgi:hypothetical protein